MSLSQAALFQRLIDLTPFSEHELATLIFTAPRRYKSHFIEKRSGKGMRRISQPTAEVKFLQRALVSQVLSSLPIHKAAVGYRKGLSIRDHARPHSNARYLLKLDFRDFFPSLNQIALNHRLELDTQFSEVERWIVCQILCMKEPGSGVPIHLSIGAPSSPFVSNYLLHEFDALLSEYASGNSMRYTRYADDLALSTNEPHRLDAAQAEVRKILGELAYLGLMLNEEKTVNVSKKRKRSLVGLTLANSGEVSIGHEKKRLLRATVHAYVNGRLSSEQVDRLRGQLAFLHGIDPEFVVNICARHGIARFTDIR